MHIYAFAIAGALRESPPPSEVSRTDTTSKMTMNVDRMPVASRAERVKEEETEEEEGHPKVSMTQLDA